MDFIGTVIAAIFVALLIAFALTFGLALMGALVVVGLAVAMIAYGRQLYYRWRFMDNASRSENGQPTQIKIIEAEYTEVKHDD